MRTFFVAILFLGSVVVLAQSDFVRGDFYVAGDTIEYYALDATGIDPGPAGIGVTWDFSDLPRMPIDDFVVYYENVSAAPNASQFPEANLVARQNAGPIDAYTFFSVSDQKFQLEGLDLPDLGVVTYSNKNLWMNFPFGYNETFFDEFVGTYTFTIQGFSGIANRTGHLDTKYDGFGTVLLPGGIRVENVRRLKLDQVVDDVVSVAGVSITTKVETETYLFFAEGDNSEVLKLTIADTTVNPPGDTFHSRVAFFRADAGSQNPQPTVSRRGVHLTNPSSNFESEVLVHNPGQGPETVTLTPYTEDGMERESVSVNLIAGATARASRQDYFGDDARSFSVGGCDGCVVSVGYRAALPGASTAQVHQTERMAQEFYFYPGEWDLLFDGAAIVNAGNQASQIVADQLDDDGNLLASVTLDSSLEPGGKVLTLFNDLFTDTPESMVRLTASQPMAVMILRISTDGRFLYHNLPLPLPPGPGDERWIAHITSETGGFDTDIYIHNSGDASGTVTLQAYDNAGNALDAVEVTVPAMATHRFAKTELFHGDTSHASISGSPDCLVTVGYRSRVPDSSTAAVHEAAPVGTEFYIYPGEWEVLFDGVALVNVGGTDAVIELTQIGDDGGERETVVLTSGLAPHAKFLNVLEGLVPEDGNTLLRVTSTQPLAILSLRLSKDSRYLYENPPLPR